MNEVEEMLNTVDEAIEAAEEVNDILGASGAESGEANSESSEVAVQSGDESGEAVVGSGTDEDPVLTTEQKKKAINLQDLIYIKKYIQNMVANAKSEVKSDAEATYYKKTDKVANAAQADNATNATILTSNSGTRKISALSEDDYVLPTVGDNDAAKIMLGSGNYKFKEVWAESFKGKADEANRLNLSDKTVIVDVNPNDGGIAYTTLEDGKYFAAYYPNYYSTNHTSTTFDRDLTYAFSPFTYVDTHNISLSNKVVYLYTPGYYNNTLGFYCIYIMNTSPDTNVDGHNTMVRLRFVNLNGEQTLVSNDRGMIYFTRFA